MQLTYTFAIGFDMDKYLASKSAVDFIVGDAAYFQSGAGFSSTDEAVPENVIADIDTAGDITASGRIYGQVSSVQEFISEDWFRQNNGQWYPRGRAGKYGAVRVAHAGRPHRRPRPALRHGGFSAVQTDCAGRRPVRPGPTRTPMPLQLCMLPMTTAIRKRSPHWAKVGDKVHLRYVEEYEYYYTDTGEIIPQEEVDAAYAGGRSVGSRAKTYRDVEYTVAAAVTIPGSLDYRFYGADQFVLGAEQFQQDSQTDSVMTYVFDVEDGADGEMEAFLADYTENVQPLFDYESKATYQAEFESMRSMFLTLGGALSLIIGLVGVLNFLNAVLTGIITRRHEFAVLQAIGMTGRQLSRMLMLEGLYYALLAMVVSLALSLTLGPLIGTGCANVFWFFTYRLSLLPLAALLPVFILLGLAIPLVTYRGAAKQSVVERLRAEE